MDKLKRYKFKNQFWHDIQPIGVIAPDGNWVEYADARSKIAALEKKVDELETKINEVKSMHNGYDPEYRAAMPDLKEPKSLKQAVKELIDEAVAIERGSWELESGGWISVYDKDRSPTEEGKVLICFGEPFFGKCTKEIECGYFDVDCGKFRMWLTDREVVGYGVTHWKPLPDLPKTDTPMTESEQIEETLNRR
jgi:hypothetical protein